MAIERVLSESECRGAYDHSTLCRDVYEHHFAGEIVHGQPLEKITIVPQVDLWVMSPPCQPHTRQHNQQAKDAQDPRSASFLHLCQLLKDLDESDLPRVILLENVVGFEASTSCRRWCTVLIEKGYRLAQFHLSPPQVGIPNDRPRYFGVAVRGVEWNGGMLESFFDDPATVPLRIHTSLPQLGAPVVNDHIAPLSDYLDTDMSDSERKALQVPTALLRKNAAWCFDIVQASKQRSACFTSAYGRYIRGTGSILYKGVNAPPQLTQLQAPEDRSFDADWAQGLEGRLRYFSGTEVARLLGLSEKFSFPAHVTTKQQWKLVGNSLNVTVAAKMVELALRVAKLKKHTVEL